MISDTQPIINGESKMTGWFPSPTGPKDWSERRPEIKELLSSKKSTKKILTASEFPTKYDLEGKCPPVRDQIFSNCTAYGLIGIAETSHFIAHGKRIRYSERFTYKTSRWLAYLKGDVGCYNRATMGSAVQFGFAPYNRFKNVKDWDKYDKTPNQMVFGVADEYQVDAYLRHDTSDMPRECVKNSIKKYLLANIPSVTGFYATPSWDDSDKGDGYIAPPDYSGQILWGHAVGVVGWDDTLQIKNMTTGEKSVGAFKLRNSWGKNAGLRGYYWLPYVYFDAGFAQDVWSILSQSWLDTGEFGY